MILLILILILITGLYNKEFFLNIFQYNYLKTENNKNCKYNYPEQKS